jgi:hypothetical protein
MKDKGFSSGMQNSFDGCLENYEQIYLILTEKQRRVRKPNRIEQRVYPWHRIVISPIGLGNSRSGSRICNRLGGLA